MVLNLAQLKKESLNIRHEIVKNINEFKKLEKLRADINEIVKEFKAKRDEKVKEIRGIIGELSKLNEEKKSSDNSKNIKSLIGLINKKEWFFQINALSIKKEEQILKEIKDLKKELNEAKKGSDAVAKIRDLVKGLESKRREYNDFHAKVIDNASKSNDLSNEMNVFQKNIKELKKKGKENAKLLDEAMLDYKKAKLLRSKNTKENREQLEKIIMEKEDQALSKLKDKKKLTTEDLLSFQQ
jgi:uncharacterized coiled-coil DUF342 family protein